MLALKFSLTGIIFNLWNNIQSIKQGIIHLLNGNIGEHAKLWFPTSSRTSPSRMWVEPLATRPDIWLDEDIVCNNRSSRATVENLFITSNTSPTVMYTIIYCNKATKTLSVVTSRTQECVYTHTLLCSAVTGIKVQSWPRPPNMYNHHRINMNAYPKNISTGWRRSWLCPSTRLEDRSHVREAFK